MVFFETNPLGRILSRFCYDVDQTELPLVTTTNATCASCFWMATSLAVMFGVVPIAAVGIVPSMVVFFLIYNLYRYCCIELQRLDNIRRSPVQALLEQMLSGGAECTRNFGKIKMFMDK